MDSIILAFQSIMRNKRRSLAMLSGIILGVSILSGIIIYSSVLQESNFESIVGNSEFEVTFKLIDNIYDESKLWELSKLLDDPRVQSHTVMTGPTTGSLINIRDLEYFKMRISAELDYQEGELTDFTPLFIRENFTQTTIYDRVIEKSLDGSFDLSDTEQNLTVIPDITARRFNLKIGDIIDHVNITVIEQKQGIQRGPPDLTGEREDLQITNVKVAGIYSQIDDSLFSAFQSAKFYFNKALLDMYGTSVNSLIKKNSNYWLAVKLDTDRFSVNDVDLLDEQIDTFINDIGEASIDPITGDDQIVGTNVIKSSLVPFTFLNIFLVIFDVILVLPMVILLLYLLVFGLNLSLEERRREIGIYKLQGGSVRQIYNILRNESFVLFSLGAIIGYAISIVAAWVISSTTSFMQFNISRIDEILDFIRIDVIALSVSFSTIFIIMMIAINKRGKGFIDMEITENVKRFQISGVNFFVRNQIDIVLIVIGIISTIVMIIDEETVWFDQTSFDPTSTLWTIIFRIIGTIALWLGGAIIGGRISKWLPRKTQRIFLSFPKLRNVGLIIRSGLKRRGDVNNLVLIIVLTLSITSLAYIQGTTDYVQNKQNLEYEIGGDFKMTFAQDNFHREDILGIEGIETVMSLPFVPGAILSQNGLIYGFDPTNISEFIWHDDGFDYKSREEVMSDFHDGDLPVVMLGSSLARKLRAEINEELNLKVTKLQPEENESSIARLKVKVIGFFDHAPGGIDSSSVIATQDTLLDLAIKIGGINLTGLEELPARNYLINAKDNEDKDRIYADLGRLNGYSELRYLDDEIGEIGLSNTFGIPGLLSMMYLTSYAAALISAFAFSAILMERRKREFAILQTIGASKRQVSLTALGENALVMASSVAWGTFVGAGLSYLMNGFFNFISDLLDLVDVPRNVVINWQILGLNALVIYIGMLLATVFSVRSSVRQDLTEATRRE